MGRKRAFARASRTRYQHRASSVNTAVEHRIKLRDTGRRAFGRRLMIQPERCDRQDVDAALVYEKRIFVGTVRRSAIFNDTKTARRNLIDDAMIEQDHTIRYILLK